MIRVEVLDDSDYPQGEVELSCDAAVDAFVEQLPDGWEVQLVGGEVCDD